MFGVSGPRVGLSEEEQKWEGYGLNVRTERAGEHDSGPPPLADPPSFPANCTGLPS